MSQALAQKPIYHRLDSNQSWSNSRLKTDFKFVLIPNCSALLKIQGPVELRASLKTSYLRRRFWSGLNTSVELMGRTALLFGSYSFPYKIEEYKV